MSEHVPAIYAVLGAGSWGTSLAYVLARRGHVVYLYDSDAKHIAHLVSEHCNKHYLPDVKRFPDTVHPTADLSQAIASARDILIVVPSHAFGSVVKTLRPLLTPSQRIVWATKGLEPGTGRLPHEMVKEECANHAMGVLSGPSFAAEVARELPTALTFASNDSQLSKDWVSLLHDTSLRIYASTDMTGVEIANTVKNVMAIAIGVADSLNYGANARAALMTRGLAEMARLGLALGGKMETFMGLAGVGDLVLTCTDNQSRNRRFGLALGRGTGAEKAREEIGQVVEGADNCMTVALLAKRHKIDMPITMQVYRLLKNEITPEQAVQNLLLRPPQRDGIQY